jgi:hypothetical protein
MAKIGKLKIDIIVVILLVIAGLKLTFGIERIIDIGLFEAVDIPGTDRELINRQAILVSAVH